MSHITINTMEIQPLILRFFGNREITAITKGNRMLLTAIEQKQVTQKSAIDKLCGMFKNTSLLSSDDFAKNKEYEKKLDEEKFKYE